MSHIIRKPFIEDLDFYSFLFQSRAFDLLGPPSTNLNAFVPGHPRNDKNLEYIIDKVVATQEKL